MSDDDDITVLHTWTIYDHPRDDPSVFVARCFEIHRAHVVPTERALRSQDVGDLRDALEDMGLTCLTRSPEDDPVIMETWI